MDLTVNASDHSKLYEAMQMMERCEQSAAKADRLDMIVGDVLARQCKNSSDNHHAENGPITNGDSGVRYPSEQHHHHDLCDETPPTEADVPLHEWVAALTHPLLGPYPNGVTPRILDRLATEAGVVRFPDHARRRWHKMWSSSNHLCVYLSDEVKAGRLRRVRFGHYSGCFENLPCTANAQVNCNSTGIEHETNGTDRFSIEPNHTDANGDMAKDESDLCLGTADGAAVSAGGIARPFPIMSLLSPPMRDRTSSYSSQNGGSRRRTYRSTLSNGDDFDESHEIALKNSTNISTNQKMLQTRRPRIKSRRHSAVLDEFGLPSLLEDPSFANVVFSMGMDVQCWTVDQSAAFVQDFGFRDGAEAFVREEIDGTALMLLKRVDILDGLRLKIGQAVKMYRYIRALQKLVGRRGSGASINESSNGDI